MKILSVDDSKATRQFIKRAVDVLGFEFLEAADGKEGLEILNTEGVRVDLILLDWNMPVMDGIEMLKILKSSSLLKGIPVTFVSTEQERQKISEALHHGARNFLIKPFSQEDLIGKIMESLGMEV
ncbi:MAG: response regulator [Desulfobacterales bacterium]|nr:response regulator [Desulfobacterales bacterium]